jgi:PIN domain nuclease of toxin-antitoxin system
MRYLLDSHTLMWALQSPGKLSGAARRIIEDPSSGLLLSIATPWELAIKSNLGKLDAGKILQKFDQLTSSGSYQVLDTKVSHVIQAGMLPHHHRDPFDRLIAAQALELRLPIVSRDRVFDLYGVTRIWS